MQIDWITVAAQIVNFLILVWLLRRFLYGPVTRAMARREQRIADRLTDAQQAKEDAAAQGRAYQDQQNELERQKQSVLAAAREAADQAKQQMLREARADADARRQEWLGQVEAQHQEFLQGVRRRATEQFFELARQVLRDMADVELEASMADVFLRRLKDIDEDARQKLVEAAKEFGQVTVESRFELGEGERRHLTSGIHEALVRDVEVAYQHDPSHSFGIELRAGSQTVLWTFDDYLNRLEQSLHDMLAQRPSEAAAPAGPAEAKAP